MNDSAPLPADGDALGKVDQVQEELVAYLDGELDAQTAADVERRLALDDNYRQQLQSLQRAWDMLDYLPRAEVGNSFSKTTVELVAVTAADEAKGKDSTLANRRRLGWLIVGGGSLAASLLGFLLVLSLFSQENKKLVEDLPMIENVDAYQNIENIEFLQLLDQEGLFVQEEEVQEEAKMREDKEGQEEEDAS